MKKEVFTRFIMGMSLIFALLLVGCQERWVGPIGSRVNPELPDWYCNSEQGAGDPGCTQLEATAMRDDDVGFASGRGRESRPIQLGEQVVEAERIPIYGEESARRGLQPRTIADFQGYGQGPDVPRNLLAGGDDRALADALGGSQSGESEWKTEEGDKNSEYLRKTEEIFCAQVDVELLRSKLTHIYSGKRYMISSRAGFGDQDLTDLTKTFTLFMGDLIGISEHPSDKNRILYARGGIDDFWHEALYALIEKDGVGAMTNSEGTIQMYNELRSDYLSGIEIIIKSSWKEKTEDQVQQEVDDPSLFPRLNQPSIKQPLLRQHYLKYKRNLKDFTEKTGLYEEWLRSVSPEEKLKKATGYDFPKECLPAMIRNR